MNPFLEACGAKGPWQLNIEGPGMAGPVALALDAPYCVVGKAAGADVQLDSQEVSDRHAYFQLLDGHLYGMDLGSRGGTFLDGNKLSAGWIEPGREVRIGQYRLRFAPDTAKGPERTPPLLEDPTFPRSTLDVLLRGVRPLRIPVATRLTLVGSSTGCAVRLLDPSVTAIHAGLIQTRCGVWVLNLQGQGGMTVNGAAVRCAPLGESDTLLIGRSTVKLCREGSAATALPAGPAPLRVEQAPDLVSTPAPSPSWDGIKLGSARPLPSVPIPPSIPIARQGPRNPGEGKVVGSESKPPPTPAPVPVAVPVAVSVAEPSPARRPAGLKPSPSSPIRPPSHAPTPPPPAAPKAIPIAESEQARKGEAHAEPDHPLRIGKSSAGASPSRGNGHGPAAAPPRKKSVEEGVPEPVSSEERRGSFRYKVPETNAQIAWWEQAPEITTKVKAKTSSTYTTIMARGPGFRNGMTATRDNTEVRREAVSVQESLVSRNVTTRLLDVSQSGLSLLSDEPLPSGRRVWFRLETERLFDWVEIIPVGDAQTALGHHSLRFAFRDSCPYDLFKTLVFETKSQKN